MMAVFPNLTQFSPLNPQTSDNKDAKRAKSDANRGKILSQTKAVKAE